MTRIQNESGAGGAFDDDSLGESFGAHASGRAARRRPLGIWLLALTNVVCAGLVLLGLRFLSAAEHYAVADSAEFGADLTATLAGIWILRICGFILLAGFLLSAIGVLSLRRLGWRVQALWATVLSFTVAGLIYGAPVLVFIRRDAVRSLFFPEGELLGLRGHLRP